MESNEENHSVDGHEQVARKQSYRSDDTRRANHNALERKRRVFQKEKLEDLRDKVPHLGKNASMGEILQKSTHYIRHLEQLMKQRERELGDLKRLNTSLMARVATAANGAPIPWPQEAFNSNQQGPNGPGQRPTEPMWSHAQEGRASDHPAYPSNGTSNLAAYPQPPPHRQGVGRAAASGYQHPDEALPSFARAAGKNTNQQSPRVPPSAHSSFPAPPPFVRISASGQPSGLTPPPGSYGNRQHPSPHPVSESPVSQGSSVSDRHYVAYPSSYSPSPYMGGNYWPNGARRGASPAAPPGSYSSSYGDNQGAPGAHPLPTQSPFSHPQTLSPNSGYLSQSVPGPGPYGRDRKRSVKLEDGPGYGRSRKISKSEAIEDAELAAEATLFHNFCETVRRNSMTISPATGYSPGRPESPAGVFDMDLDDRGRGRGGDRTGGSKLASGNPPVFIQDEDADVNELDEPESMCYCGRGWDGKMMIMCDKCQRWLHGACAGLPGRVRPSAYVCEQCNNST